MEIEVEGSTARITIPGLSLDDYRDFLAIKRLPSYEIVGNTIVTDSAYLDLLPGRKKQRKQRALKLSDYLWDYQAWIVRLALARRRYAVLSDCGSGKTAIFLEWSRQLLRQLPTEKKVLIISPLMVIEQTREEYRRWYKREDLLNLHRDMSMDDWLGSESRFAIINYDYFKQSRDLQHRIGAVVLDESSILKHFGSVIRTNLINCFGGLEYKLCCTATPAPNDREEYANHALFLEKIRSYQEFFHKYFVNRNNHWQLKSHAEPSFYRHLAGYSIFLRSPAHYGFADNLRDLQPPIITEIRVPATAGQEDAIRIMAKDPQLFNVSDPSGIVERGKYAQISKGFVYGNNGKARRIDSRKPRIIRELLAQYPNEQALVWTQYDEEGEILLEELRDCGREVANLNGKMPQSDRHVLIERFRHGGLDIMISKPRLLGFGFNFQHVSMMVFSAVTDSYESFYQAIKRAHRYGATKQLRVYIPYTQYEEPMLRNVLRKKAQWEQDGERQEQYYIKSMKGELCKLKNAANRS